MTIRNSAAEIDRLIAKRAKVQARLEQLDQDIRSATARLVAKVGVPLSEGTEVADSTFGGVTVTVPAGSLTLRNDAA